MIDEVVAVHSDDASVMAVKLWLIGLPVGVSAGAIVDAAVKVCRRPESAGKLVVAIFPALVRNICLDSTLLCFFLMFVEMASKALLMLSSHCLVNLLSSSHTGERYFTHPMFSQI